jgi:parallel beta-helix repeat protein
LTVPWVPTAPQTGKPTFVNGVTGYDAARHSTIADTVDRLCTVVHRTATFTVAASNSSANEKASADYVCDGTDDQVEINNAINAAAALSAAGGDVLLLGGTYTLGAQIRPKSNVTLRGVGDASVIKPSAGMTAGQALVYNYAADAGPDDAGIVIRELCFDGAKDTVGVNHYAIYLKYATRSLITNCTFRNFQSEIIHLTCNVAASDSKNNAVIGCRFSNNLQTAVSAQSQGNIIADNILTYPNSAGGGGIMVNTAYNIVSGNVIIGQAAVAIAVGGDHQVIEGNTIAGAMSFGISVSYASFCLIRNNEIYGVGVAGANGYGIGLAAGGQNNVSGNLIHNCMYFGIWVYVGTTENLISGNILYANSQTSDLGYPHINIQDASHRNTIMGNIMRAGGGSNKCNYGVFVAAGSNYNIIVHNDLYTAGAISAISDHGTGTVMTLSGNQTA